MVDFPKEKSLQNDTAVYDAMAYNPSTINYDIWVGLGTLEAIKKRDLKPDMATLRYCPKEWLTDGFRPKDAPPPEKY
jgi:hypothetical protein